MATCNRCNGQGTIVHKGQVIACPDCADRIQRGD
jgi:DNA-directed RNA polymerase subunit RPC12/RpoP